MGIFGWSYPPGCSGPPDDDYDDSICYFCQEKLPDVDEMETIPPHLDEGYCCEDHRVRGNAGERIGDKTWSVAEFCQHIGVSPIKTALRAIDRHNTESVDVCINGTWYSHEDDMSAIREDSRISAAKVRGIAWGGSDWEWARVVESKAGLAALDAAREDFEAAHDEYVNARQADADDDAEDDYLDRVQSGYDVRQGTLATRMLGRFCCPVDPTPVEAGWMHNLLESWSEIPVGPDLSEAEFDKLTGRTLYDFLWLLSNCHRTVLVRHSPLGLIRYSVASIDMPMQPPTAQHLDIATIVLPRFGQCKFAFYGEDAE